MRDFRRKLWYYSALDSADHKEKEYLLKSIAEYENIFIDSLNLREQLIEVGILINSCDDLVNTNESYPEAIPILWQYLVNHPEDPKNYRESYIRALSVKESKGIGVSPFVREFIWGASNPNFRNDGNDYGHMSAAVQAIKCSVVKGEFDKIKTCLEYLEKANIPNGARESMRKDLLIAFKRGGGKLPL
jgi:hypothetical protein